MSHTPLWIPGKRWVVCDRCGFDFRIDEVAREWTGLTVCKATCLDERNPQELRRHEARQEGKVSGPVRPPPATETFVDVTFAAVSDDDVPSGTFNTNTL